MPGRAIKVLSPQSFEADFGRKLRLAPRLSEWEGLDIVCKQQSQEKRGAGSTILNVKNFNTFAVNTAKK